MDADLQQLADFYNLNGYGVLHGFVSEEGCDRMMDRMRGLVDEWFQSSPLNVENRKKGDSKEGLHLFTTAPGDHEQSKDEYFLESANKIHFFLESGAIDEETKLLKPEISPQECLNKVGHGLHCIDDVFREYSTSKKMHDLVRALGYKDPVLPQSMYIFKHKLIGGEVVSHQDSTYLYTTPRTTCLGLWLALEDATLENGCLWARPGSHKEPVRRQFVRNPEYFSSGKGDIMTFRPHPEQEEKEWEGKIPSPSPESAGFVPVPVKKGDLFLIHGQVDHLSLANTSPKGRQTFQLHLIEGPGEGITWSPENWLQYPAGCSFPKV